MIGIIRKIVGSKNDRELKRLAPLVDRINAVESSVQVVPDEALVGKTVEFRARLQSGEQVDDLLPEAFAVVREASRRVLGMRHFDVQLIGGIALHEGKIAEMRTGEGKTLVATLPVYLNALNGKGVHVVTVNDYLAKRDSQWMGELYRFLGLTVGVIQHDLDDAARQAAYSSDVTYGTNNEFGFDYLRDNMKFDPRQFVQRPLGFAIVDEVDSILIDEARTPLIISGPAEDSTELYYKINKAIPYLKADVDYAIEEKTKTAALTEEGNAKIERFLGVENLYDLGNMSLVHHVHQALKAHSLYKRDVDYVVKDGEVLIVDEFTGRLMPGRRWSDGLHQAVEAKEGVRIANENQTLATITFQNFFRMYKKLSGMTGTADTEAAEFAKIYNLDVMVVPPNRQMVREDAPDVVYRTEREKFAAIAEEIVDCHQRGQPVLVGTISIEKSERLSALLKKQGIKHAVLNAKFHEKEAEIIAQAGRKDAVTIATNMAGRGTDILLGGNPDFLFKQWLAREPDMAEPGAEVQRREARERFRAECEAEKREVIAAGGLHIIGTERHESRRIDNQLRGRAGRQGDPGSSRFYLSLEDDLLRIFGAERISGLMQRLGMEEGVPIEHRMVTRAIETAQKKVEAHNFDIRKQLLEYDDVMNKQREVIYEQRRQVLSGAPFVDDINGMIEDVIDSLVAQYCSAASYTEAWDLKGLTEALNTQFSLTFESNAWQGVGIDAVKEGIRQEVRQAYERKEKEFGSTVLRELEKAVMLRVIDTHWKDHLLTMDYLKEGIGLRGYGQKDPLIEYKREGFDLFAGMIDRMKFDAIGHLFRIQAIRQEPVVRPSPPPIFSVPGLAPQAAPSSGHRDKERIGRNDLCPCGSGKKYKKCHGG
ncbi:MAG: preprotein translocase subunit SecA [Nitrospirae bacterium]|nr:preprotein translocase subunit SecA [Nitrospirota bacterium]